MTDVGSKLTILLLYFAGQKSACAYNTHPHLKTTVEPVIVATCIERPPLQKSQLQIPNTNTLIHLSKATY